MKSMKRIAVLVLALVLCLSASAAMAVSVTTEQQLKDALSGITADTTIDVENAITVKWGNPFTVDAGGHDVVINLKGNTLTFDGGSKKTVLNFHNGNFTINGGNGGSIVTQNYTSKSSYGILANNQANLIVNKTTFSGTFVGQSVVHAGAAGPNNLTFNECTFDFDNNGHGYIINTTAATAEKASHIRLNNCTMDVTGSKYGINMHENQTLSVDGSTITLTNMLDNGINLNKNASASFSNSKVTINGTKERGVTLRPGATLKLSKGTVFNLSNCEKGDLTFYNAAIPAEAISIDATSNMYFDTVKQTSNGEAYETIYPEAYEKAYKLPDGAIITQLADGTYYVGVPAKAIAPNLDLPRTGDGSSLMLWAALAAMSAAGFVTMKKRQAN